MCLSACSTWPALKPRRSRWSPKSCRCENCLKPDCEFSQQCQDKQLTWRVSPTDDWLLTDPVLALRMLRNLIENAIRYTPAGQVHLRARKKGHLMYLQVWDTGTGISQTDQIQVFRDYFQVKNEARRAQDGLGLGLGVVRRLAALTGAQISLRSRPAKRIMLQHGPATRPAPSRPAGTGGESSPEDRPHHRANHQVKACSSLTIKSMCWTRCPWF